MGIGRLSTLPRTDLLAVALAVALAAGVAATVAAEDVPPRKGQEPQPPVRITAESAEYFNAESLVVFAGKVVAVQADTTLTAERMEVRFTQAAAQPDGKPGRHRRAGAGTAHRVDHRPAERHVPAGGP
jgi:lipopolysaccharide export system protein LptA